MAKNAKSRTKPSARHSTSLRAQIQPLIELAQTPLARELIASGLVAAAAAIASGRSLKLGVAATGNSATDTSDLAERAGRMVTAAIRHFLPTQAERATQR